MLLWCKLQPFKQNHLATVFFKVMQYGYEIFQTALSLNCKIIWCYFSNSLRSDENNLIYFRNKWVMRENESLLLVEPCSRSRAVFSCNMLRGNKVKGHFRYKTITPQNVLSGVQVKNFFISQKNYVPFSRYSHFCIFKHTMIYQICDVMMSIVHETESALLNISFEPQLFKSQTWPADRFKHGQ